MWPDLDSGTLCSVDVTELLDSLGNRQLRSLWARLRLTDRARKADEAGKIGLLFQRAAAEGIPLVASRRSNPIMGDVFVYNAAKYPIMQKGSTVHVVLVRHKDRDSFVLMLDDGTFVDSYGNEDEAKKAATILDARAPYLLDRLRTGKNVRDMTYVANQVRFIIKSQAKTERVRAKKIEDAQKDAAETDSEESDAGRVSPAQSARKKGAK